MNFWSLLETKKCDVCNTDLIHLGNDEFWYCPKCQDELSLCGNYDQCEGIAHNGPYALIDGKLQEIESLVNGYCETCGSGWELA